MSAKKDCLLEVIEQALVPEEVEELDGEMEISMHVLSGLFDPRTIRLEGSIAG